MKDGITINLLEIDEEALENLSLPGDLRQEMLDAEGETSVEVWWSGEGEAACLSRWSSGRGSYTHGSDSEWGDWGARDEDGLPVPCLWLDRGGWVDVEGNVYGEDL